MMTFWKAAVAAAAMVAAAQQAQAVRWVEYTIVGFGTISEQITPVFQPPSFTTRDTNVLIRFYVDADEGFGFVDQLLYTSTGSEYSARDLGSTPPVDYFATFTPDAITGSADFLTSGNSFSYTAAFTPTDRTIRYTAGSVGPDGFRRISVNATALQLSTTQVSEGRRFSFDTNVPEPTTWAMLIVGFGTIGASMRRKTFRPSLG